MVFQSVQVEGAKKAYHAACKEEKLAISRETNSKADPALNPEQLKKLQDKVEKSKQDSQKVTDMPANLPPLVFVQEFFQLYSNLVVYRTDVTPCRANTQCNVYTVQTCLPLWCNLCMP